MKNPLCEKKVRDSLTVLLAVSTQVLFPAIIGPCTDCLGKYLSIEGSLCWSSVCVLYFNVMLWWDDSKFRAE